MISTKPKTGMNRLSALLLILLSTLISSHSAHALQIKEGKDGDTLIAKISANDSTRIAMADGRVSHLTFKDEDLIVEKDAKLGQYKIIPGPTATPGRPISAFLTDANRNTYTLLLQVEDLPSDTILIKEKGNTVAVQSVDKASDYERGIKNLILLVQRDPRDPGVEVEQVQQTIPLWNESFFILEKVYKTSKYFGEKYSLTNISNSEMVLTESEFLRDGVTGVLIKDHILSPKMKTDVIIIRKKETNGHE